MCAPTARNTASKRPSRLRREHVVDLRVQLERRRRGRRCAAISASSTSRGRRYFGMPKRIMPPASGPASRIVTAWPDAREVVGGGESRGPGADHQHALARATSRPTSNFQPRAQRLVAEEALDRVDADAFVELRRGCTPSRTGGSRRGPCTAGSGLSSRQQRARPARSRRTRRGTASPGCSRPAGQAWLHGGRRSTYTGRTVRHEPVWLARLEPGSSVIANGLRFTARPPRRPPGRSARMLRSASCLDPRDDVAGDPAA